MILLVIVLAGKTNINTDYKMKAWFHKARLELGECTKDPPNGRGFNQIPLNVPKPT